MDQLIESQRTGKTEYIKSHTQTLVEVPVVPKPPQNNSMQTHAKRSFYSIAGTYVALAGIGLVAGAVSGQFGHFTPAMLSVLVVVGPILTAACKDYLHWADTGDWPDESSSEV